MPILNPEHLKVPDPKYLDFPYLKICKFWFDPETNSVVFSHPYFKKWEEKFPDYYANFRIWFTEQGIEDGDELFSDYLMYSDQIAEKLLTPS